jgi:vacuolar-type H+-ATPase subunit H
LSASTVEQVVKVLMEFEAELDKIKVEAVDTRKRLSKLAAEEGEKAKQQSIEKAQRTAEESVKKAREEAEREADHILTKGEESLKETREKISGNKSQAAQYVLKNLLGE